MSDTPYMDAVRELAKTPVTQGQFADIMRRGAESISRMSVMDAIWRAQFEWREAKRSRRRLRMARKRRRGWV